MISQVQSVDCVLLITMWGPSDGKIFQILQALSFPEHKPLLISIQGEPSCKQTVFLHTDFTSLFNL